MMKRKFADGGLADDETRLSTWDRLPQDEKDAVVAGRKKAVSAAEAERTRPLSSRAVDAYYELNPFVPERVKKEQRQSATEDSAARASRYSRAKQELDNTGVADRRLYGTKQPQKLKDQPAMFAKGGNVRKVKKLNTGQKQAVTQLLQQARGAGAPPPPGPGAPMPMAPTAPGMKKGGFVPFAKKSEKAEGESKAMDKKEGKAGEAKEKWVPPWAKKTKKMASGGSVVCAAGGRIGGKGDGIITRGATKGRMA